MRSSLFAVSLTLVINLTSHFRLQGVAVKGRLFCGKTVLRNTRVKLYDIDTNPGDSDDLLDEQYISKNGEFAVDGTTRELTDIDPILYIYHDCEDGIRPCQKRIALTIPKRYINHGSEKEWFNVGDLNLEIAYPGEDRSCNH